MATALHSCSCNITVNSAERAGQDQRVLGRNPSIEQSMAEQSMAYMTLLLALKLAGNICADDAFGMQDFMTSVGCFLVEYLAPIDGRITEDETGLARLLKNTHEKEMPASCLHLKQGTRICSIRSNKAPRMVKTVLPILADLVNREDDILLMNFGAW